MSSCYVVQLFAQNNTFCIVLCQPFYSSIFTKGEEWERYVCDIGILVPEYCLLLYIALFTQIGVWVYITDFVIYNMLYDLFTACWWPTRPYFGGFAISVVVLEISTSLNHTIFVGFLFSVYTSVTSHSSKFSIETPLRENCIHPSEGDKVHNQYWVEDCIFMPTGGNFEWLVSSAHFACPL